MQTKITIRNEAQVCYIDIEGTIGIPEESQFEDSSSRVATFEAFRREVKRIGDVSAKRVIVNIRSTGGDVNNALLIYDALRALDADITTRCFGYTASAATIIAQAADEGQREISANALYLIHNSTCSIEGNSASLEARTELLRKTDEQLARLYALHSGRDEAYFAELMAENNGEGRWLSAEECIEAGLADTIIDYEDEHLFAPDTEEDMDEELKRAIEEQDEQTGAAESNNTLPSDQSNQSSEEKPSKPARPAKRGKRQAKRASTETAWGSIIRYLLNRLATRIDEWIDSLQEKRKKKQEQSADEEQTTSRRKKRGEKTKKGNTTTEQPATPAEQPQSAPDTTSPDLPAAPAEGDTADGALPQGSARSASAIYFTSRQRRFAASQVKSIEDPSINRNELNANAQAYAEDAKVFDR